MRWWIAPRDVELGEYAESIVTVIEEAEMSKALELYVSSMHWLDAIRFQFEEQDRDDWSVYLYDGSRNVDIQTDLWTGKIMYAAGGEPLRELYEVLAESD